MAAPSDTAALHRDPALSDEQVAEHLRRHSDFLIKHPDLLPALMSPSRASGDAVADFQTFMIERLRSEIERLKEHRDALVTSNRTSRSVQAQVHAAVIAMLGATSFEHLIDVVTVDFLRLLHIDVVALCVENDGNRQPCRRSGVLCLEPGTIDDLLSAERDIVFAPRTYGDERVFGAGTGLVNSSALLRLRLGDGAPHCLLALGSRYEDGFPPGRSTALYAFLARALEHCLRAWLDLPR
ncbi:MAG: DUF484 family protein [Alphaproteobacteria bacterium]